MSAPRVVVVTGASRGIGEACAAVFAHGGDRVAALSSSGTCALDGVVSVKCDVTDSTSVDSAFGSNSTRGSASSALAT